MIKYDLILKKNKFKNYKALFVIKPNLCTRVKLCSTSLINTSTGVKPNGSPYTNSSIPIKYSTSAKHVCIQLKYQAYLYNETVN